MHAQLTYKQNEKQYYKHTLEFSLVVWHCRSEKLAKFINRNQQTANSQLARTPVFLVYFLQKATANNKSVTLRLAPLAYNNAYKKFLEHVQRCDIFRLILHSWRFRFLSQWASACVSRSEKSFQAKLSNETSFNMDSILICTRWLVNQKAHSTHCSRSTTGRGIQLCNTLTLVP